MFARLAAHLAASQKTPFEFAVVDEAQDINPSQLRFLAALGGGRANSLFLSGIWANEFSSKRFPGSHWVLIFVNGHRRCASSTERLTRSERNQIDCWDRKCLMLETSVQS